MLALPLIAEGSPIGSLVLYSDESDAFDEKEIDLLQQAASDVAQEIVLLRARVARTRAEEALKKTESDLARVARLTTMGELTASIAHEINQPLAALVTNASACLRWLAADPPNLKEARATAQRIMRDGNRAANVIARIRALLAKGEPARQLLNINDVIEEIVLLVRGELKRRGTTLQTKFAEGLPQVEFDRVQIQQVLMNLIVNALEAMDEVKDRPHVLQIQTSADQADAVCVTVRDSGAGLSPDHIERLFDAFYSTKANGMGMGLSISRSIVQAHQGRLWAEANSGPGAAFKFTLPLSDAACMTS
jgi:C4-dicarboxylate-specific signal transduction histidine kinase